MSQPQRVDSPCIGVCQLDAERTCIGCFRRIDEIAEWGRAHPDRQRAIVAQALARARAAQREAARPVREDGEQ